MPTRELARRMALTVTALVVTCPLGGAPPAKTKVLATFCQGVDVQRVLPQNATVSTAGEGDATVLRVVTGRDASWPGFTIRAPDGLWDLSAYEHIAVDVRNVDSKSVRVHCRVDSRGGDGVKNSVTGSVVMSPGERRLLRVPLRRQLPEPLAEKLFGMRGYPGGYSKERGVDASAITQLVIFLNRPQRGYRFEIKDIAAYGEHEAVKWLSMTPDEFFPMIDRFGQFLHKNWPGKTSAEVDFQSDIVRESEDLAAHPSSEEWNQYGGWKIGPRLKASGFFYPTRYEGKWWLVDPEGRLFWSHGVDCVGAGQGSTPISDREFYYAGLPRKDSPLAQFYGRGSWAPHGYYKDKGVYRTFNFARANLMRKYGKDWYEKTAAAIHRRLRSWSMNTIANWSDSGIYLRRKTPYVVSSGSGGATPIEGSAGYWRPFPDPFDPSFRAALRRRMSGERGKSAGDPWCIGYFVDNELGWGDELSLAKATLASPPTQAAKSEFISDLRKKYTTIAALNAAWGTEHDSWEALVQCRTPPDDAKAHADLASFYTRIAEEYFRVCREVVKEVAPNNLYLGCRFAWVNERAVRAAGKYCDVIGYNLYRDSVADFRLPSGLDRPVVIGEFHFGALDRGLFHTGLRPTANQQARAEAYRDYVTGALRNSVIVGTHWFQYGDQATTGRGDGENYQIGLVDICDKPYPETIRAVREVGGSMYHTRLSAPVLGSK